MEMRPWDSSEAIPHSHTSDILWELFLSSSAQHRARGAVSCRLVCLQDLPQNSSCYMRTAEVFAGGVGGISGQTLKGKGCSPWGSSGCFASCPKIVPHIGPSAVYPNLTFFWMNGLSTLSPYPPGTTPFYPGSLQVGKDNLETQPEMQKSLLSLKRESRFLQAQSLSAGSQRDKQDTSPLGHGEVMQGIHLLCL